MAMRMAERFIESIETLVRLERAVGSEGGVSSET